MKYSLCLPVDQVEPPSEFCSAAAIKEMAQAAEAVGFDAVHATEHPFPAVIGADMGGHHSFDPVVCLSFAAAATTRIKLHFNSFVVPFRNPFLAAKNLADLDVASGGRVIAGMAAGYMASEFDALGVSIKDRGAIFDEALVAIKAAWTGNPVHMKSAHWEAKGNVMRPRPIQQPHVPIWVGGNSRLAIKRAAKFGQGWTAFPAQPKESAAVRTGNMLDIDNLRKGIQLLREETKAAGRTETLDVCMSPFTHQHHPRGKENYDPPVLLEEAQKLSEIGVTWLSVKARSPNRKTFLENIERWGKDVLHAKT